MKENKIIQDCSVKKTLIKISFNRHLVNGTYYYVTAKCVTLYTRRTVRTLLYFNILVVFVYSFLHKERRRCSNNTATRTKALINLKLLTLRERAYTVYGFTFFVLFY